MKKKKKSPASVSRNYAVLRCIWYCCYISGLFYYDNMFAYSGDWLYVSLAQNVHVIIQHIPFKYMSHNDNVCALQRIHPLSVAMIMPGFATINILSGKEPKGCVLFCIFFSGHCYFRTIFMVHQQNICTICVGLMFWYMIASQMLLNLLRLNTVGMVDELYSSTTRNCVQQGKQFMFCAISDNGHCCKDIWTNDIFSVYIPEDALLQQLIMLPIICNQLEFSKAFRR